MQNLVHPEAHTILIPLFYHTYKHHLRLRQPHYLHHVPPSSPLNHTCDIKAKSLRLASTLTVTFTSHANWIRTTSRGADSMGWLRLMDQRHWRLSSRPCLPAHWLLASKLTGYLQYPSNANSPNTFPTRSSLSSILLTDMMGFCSSSSKSTHISCAF